MNAKASLLLNNLKAFAFLDAILRRNAYFAKSFFFKI